MTQDQLTISTDIDEFRKSEVTGIGEIIRQEEAMKRGKMHKSAIESLPETKTVYVGVKLRQVKNNH